MNENLNQNSDCPSLQNLISDLGLTQEKVAQLAGVTLGTVNSWACGRKVPRTDHFLKLCQILDVSPKTLANIMGFNIEGIPNDISIEKSNSP